MADDFRERTWWGTFPVEEGAATRWRIGPLAVYAHRQRHEWRVVFSTVGAALDRSLEPMRHCSPDEIPDTPDAVRFAFLRSPPAIRLDPVLADRSMVLRPEQTLLVPPGDAVEVFVSTPLWLRVSFGDDLNALEPGPKQGHEKNHERLRKPSQPVAHEVPIFRPSDTWFGPTTLEGEMCYASRTHAFLSLDDVPRYPHRARTIVHVRNRGVDVLRVDRLNVPVRHLSLFAADDRSLWTERVTLTRDADGAMAAMRVGAGPPREIRGALRVGEPRDRVETNLVIRAFEAFFREKDRWVDI